MAVDECKYRPAVEFRRTDDERHDQLLSWNRSDAAFFAAGACHILAFQLLERHPNSHVELVHVRPLDTQLGAHVFVSDGHWGFDFGGWTPERTILDRSAAACASIEPGWRYERFIVTQTLEEFCATHHHRPPQDFAFDPRPRADAYLDRFGPVPPHPAQNRRAREDAI